MDISKQQQEPDGEALISKVVAASGLPQELVSSELQAIVETAGHEPESLTLEQLRSAMLAYLESINESVTAGEDSESSAVSE